MNYDTVLQVILHEFHPEYSQFLRSTSPQRKGSFVGINASFGRSDSPINGPWNPILQIRHTALKQRNQYKNKRLLHHKEQEMNILQLSILETEQAHSKPHSEYQLKRNLKNHIKHKLQAIRIFLIATIYFRSRHISEYP